MVLRTKRRPSTRRTVLSLLATLLLPPALSSIALAEPATGACCLVGGVCEDLMSFTCEEQGGTFLGHGTDCSETACERSFAAPMFSILGLVAAVGMLGALGLYRLLFRSR